MTRLRSLPEDPVDRTRLPVDEWRRSSRGRAATWA